MRSPGALTHYVDAVFETVSGLDHHRLHGVSGGGASAPQRSAVALPDPVDGRHGRAVLFLALMPKLGDGAVYLMRAESPGPIKSKLVPKVGSTAKILYAIYVALTVLEMVCLRLAGATWFSAVNHAFTTMATGGFSIYNTSLSGASPAVMWIVTAFSFLAGVNFSLPFLAVTGRLRSRPAQRGAAGLPVHCGGRHAADLPGACGCGRVCRWANPSRTGRRSRP